MYENIMTYAVNRDSNSNYREINTLIKENIENGTMPFLSKPLPPDMNIITGKTRMDINKEKIALKAAAIGAGSTLWIYGADAAQLGLELKANNPVEFRNAVKKNPNFNCKPIVMQNARERFSDIKLLGKSDTLSESLCIDCQCAYLLDQFTDKSVQRLFTEKITENKLPYAAFMAKEIIKNRTEYNSGKKAEDQTRLIKQNLFLNLQKKSPVFQEIINTRNNYLKDYLPEQKVVFDFYYKYYNEQQAGGENLYNFSGEQKNDVIKSLQGLLQKIDASKGEKNEKKIEGIITRTIFDAYSFSQRLTHYNFSLEPIYSRDEQLKRDANRRIPAAMEKTAQSQNKTVLTDLTKEKYKRRSFSMHVGENQGM